MDVVSKDEGLFHSRFISALIGDDGVFLLCGFCTASAGQTDKRRLPNQRLNFLGIRRHRIMFTGWTACVQDNSSVVTTGGNEFNTEWVCNIAFSTTYPQFPTITMYSGNFRIAHSAGMWDSDKPPSTASRRLVKEAAVPPAY